MIVSAKESVECDNYSGYIMDSKQSNPGIQQDPETSAEKETPDILLRAKGTIDEYMQQLMDAKSEAIDEGIDYQDAVEFDPAKWLSYRDFTIKMLKEEGYDVNNFTLND